MILDIFYRFRFLDVYTLLMKWIDFLKQAKLPFNEKMFKMSNLKKKVLMNKMNSVSLCVCCFCVYSYKRINVVRLIAML